MLKSYPHLHISLYCRDSLKVGLELSRLATHVGSISDFVTGWREQGAWYYLCASPGRVYEWVDRLQAIGVPPNMMGSDVFEYAPR